MKHGQTYKRALALAVPMMIQNGITNAVGLVDNLMVGSLGTEAFTAVSIVGQLIFVFNLAIFGGMSGPGIYGAQYYGQRNLEGFRGTVRIKHLIGLGVLLAGLAAFIFGGEPLIGLYLKGESADIDPALTMSHAKQYLSIMLWGLPPFVVTQIYAGSLRETGASVKPMAAGVASVLIDVLFNYLLIYGKLGFPRLGVRGAAIATVMSRFAEMLIVVLWTFIARRKHEFLIGLYKTLLLPKADAKKIIVKSLPIFFNEFLWAGGMAVLTQCYSLRGLDIVAGLNISNALCNMLNVVFIALGNAVGILVGQTLGAARYKEAKSEAFGLMWFTGGVSLLLTAILTAISGIFPSCYDTTPEVRSLATGFIVITALFFPLQGFLNALYFTLRSGGKTLVTFLFDSVFSWAVSVPAAFLLCSFTTLPIMPIYAIVQSLDFIKVTVGYILVKKGVWISSLVEEKAQHFNTER
ncbi:MAG: MATE family efflux transporter [Lachnospiraceae bacterium]|nr:MATE family efflux transporter [Ruminococcus sp.]MCM1273756.1 MATE family efflux transporter [Lachnospiraceae bacterium]